MTNRKANYDLLRVFAMLGIILFHHFGNYTPNYFVELTDGFTPNQYFYDFINNTPYLPGSVSLVSLLMDFCYCHFGSGGNYIFMLLTGYFLFDRTISVPANVQKVGKLLFALLFYGILLTIINYIILKCFYPFSCYPTYRPLFRLPNWLSGKNMWYVQAYGLFILVILPLLKLFEGKLTQKSHFSLAVSLVFIRFLAYSEYLPNLWLNTRMMDFIMWYYVGGYFSKYRVKISKKQLITFICIYCVSFFAYEYYWRYTCSVEYEPTEYSYIEVMSPFVCCFIFAILGFFFFDYLQIKNGTLSKTLRKLSSATIGIYIFHFNVITMSFLLANSFCWHIWSRKGYFLFSIIDSIILFIVGFMVDIIRQHLYKHAERYIKDHFCRPAKTTS